MRWVAILALCFAVSAPAQVRPVPGPGDPRLQTIAYDPDQVVQLQVAMGYQLTIILSADERIENVAVGDSDGWQIVPNKRGDHLFIKATSGATTTNLTVITDARTYSFDLSTTFGALGDMPYTLRFRYPETESQAVAVVPEAKTPGRYRLTGAKALRPSAMSDDGERTYIEWAEDQTLPAIFALDEHGEELLADGHMRDGQYTIDAVRQGYIFRLNKQTAHASRLREKSRQ